MFVPALPLQPQVFVPALLLQPQVGRLLQPQVFVLTLPLQPQVFVPALPLQPQVFVPALPQLQEVVPALPELEQQRQPQPAEGLPVPVFGQLGSPPTPNGGNTGIGPGVFVGGNGGNGGWPKPFPLKP